MPVAVRLVRVDLRYWLHLIRYPVCGSKFEPGTFRMESGVLITVSLCSVPLALGWERISQVKQEIISKF